MSRLGNETSALPAAVRRRMWWRLLGLQATWNQQRMQNVGLLVALGPWVDWRAVPAEERRRIARRYLGYFNTNPYLAPYVVGGLVRLEDERQRGGAVPDRLVIGFRDSLSRACGAIGDQLFWLGMRPAVLALAALAGWALAWWLAPLVIGVVAAGQLVMRWRGLDLGYRRGPDVVAVLERRAWHRAVAWTGRAALVLTGLLGGLFFAAVFAAGNEVDPLRVASSVAVGLGIAVLLRPQRAGEVHFLAGVALIAVLGLVI